MSYRLDQYLTLAGEGSRSQVKQFLKKGLVQVDGITEKQAKRKVLGNEQITLNGKPVYYEEHCYLMLHKPAGVVTATEDKKEKTVMDLITLQQKKDLFPVGRLDKDTEGLLLITNDGVLSHDLLAPGKHVWKTYFVRVQGILEDKDIERLENGMDIGDDRMTLPAKVKRLDAVSLSLSADDPGYPGDTESCLELSIREGRFHQVKRMLAGVGHPVLYLKRLSMGSLRLDEALKQGEYRRLTPEEIAALQKK